MSTIVYYDYLSSVISDISESKSSAVTVVRAEWEDVTAEKERGEDKVMKVIIIIKYYLWHGEHHVYCSSVELTVLILVLILKWVEQ